MKPALSPCYKIGRRTYADNLHHTFFRPGQRAHDKITYHFSLKGSEKCLKLLRHFSALADSQHPLRSNDPYPEGGVSVPGRQPAPDPE